MSEWTKLTGVETMKLIPAVVLDKLNSMSDYQKEYLVWQMIEEKVKHVGVRGLLNYIEANIVLAREEDTK